MPVIAVHVLSPTIVQKKLISNSHCYLTKGDNDVKRSQIVKELIEKFGEKNPDVSTFYKTKKY